MKKGFPLLIVLLFLRITAFSQTDTTANPERQMIEAKMAMEQYFERRAMVQAIKDSINSKLDSAMAARKGKMKVPTKSRSRPPKTL